MELKTKVSIEFTKGDGEKSRNYQFIMDYGCPLGEAYDACHDVLQKILELSKQANDRAKQRKDSEDN